MAAMGTFQLSEAFGNLERRAEGNYDGPPGYTKPPPPNPTSSSPDSPSHPHSAYSRAYFNPRILLVFLLAISVPTIYIFLYVGALWNPQSRLHNVIVHLINLDQGVDRAALAAANGLNATGNATLYTLLPTDNVGLTLSSQLLTSAATASLFAWRYFDASNAPYRSLAEAENAVRDGSADQWQTLFIPPTYTANYLSQGLNVYSLAQLNGDFYSLSTAGALPSPLNGSYTNPIYQVWDQARNYATQSFVSSATTSALAGLGTATTAELYRNIATLPVGTSYFKASFLLAPVPVTSINVHPVPFYGMKSAMQRSVDAETCSH